jgi:hypothetical protein
MPSSVFFILPLLYGVYVFIVSIRNIRIGKGIVQHPMYDTPAKKKYILIRGIVGAILSGVCGLFFVLLLIIFII